jgi:hypothetical protein
MPDAYIVDAVRTPVGPVTGASPVRIRPTWVHMSSGR